MWRELQVVVEDRLNPDSIWAEPSGLYPDLRSRPGTPSRTNLSVTSATGQSAASPHLFGQSRNIVGNRDSRVGQYGGRLQRGSRFGTRVARRPEIDRVTLASDVFVVGVTREHLLGCL